MFLLYLAPAGKPATPGQEFWYLAQGYVYSPRIGPETHFNERMKNAEHFRHPPKHSKWSHLILTPPLMRGTM